MHQAKRGLTAGCLPLCSTCDGFVCHRGWYCLQRGLRRNVCYLDSLSPFSPCSGLEGSLTPLRRAARQAPGSARQRAQAAPAEEPAAAGRAQLQRRIARPRQPHRPALAAGRLPEAAVARGGGLPAGVAAADAHIQPAAAAINAGRIHPPRRWRCPVDKRCCRCSPPPACGPGSACESCSADAAPTRNSASSTPWVHRDG